MVKKMVINQVDQLKGLPIQLWTALISDSPSKWRHIFDSAFTITDDQKDKVLLFKKHQLINSYTTWHIRDYRDYNFIIIITQEVDKVSLEATLNFRDVKTGRPKLYKVIRTYNRPGIVTEAKIANQLNRFAKLGISNALAWSERNKK